MKFTTVAVISAALVASAPTPGIGESAWNAITYIPKKIGTCLGSCIHGAESAVTVEVPAAVHGLGNDLSAGAKIVKHEVQESTETLAAKLHREEESIIAIRKAEQRAQEREEQMIANAKHAQRHEEYIAKRSAMTDAYAAFKKAVDERRAAFENSQTIGKLNDQEAYEAALASYHIKKIAEEEATAAYRASRDDFMRGRLSEFFRVPSSEHLQH